MRSLCSAVALTVVAASTASRVAHAQSLAMIGGAAAAHVEQEQKHQAAEQRQKKMVSDADQLVAMAQQLKTSVDKSNKDTLSLDVIREAERIEKLARQLRETMRQ